MTDQNTSAAQAVRAEEPQNQPLPQTLADSAFAAPKTPEAPQPQPKIEITPENMSDELFAAVRRGDVERTRELLNYNADGAGSDANGPSTIVATATEHQKEVAQEQALHRDPQLQAHRDRGMTLLMVAAAGGNIEVAKLLLNAMDRGALENEDGLAASEVARARGDFGLAELLMQRFRQKEANEEVAREEAAEAKAQDNKEMDETAKAIFGGAPDAAPAVEAPAPEAPRGIMHRMSKFFGLSKYFGNGPAADGPAPDVAAAPQRGNLVMNFLQSFRPKPPGMS